MAAEDGPGPAAVPYCWDQCILPHGAGAGPTEEGVSYWLTRLKRHHGGRWWAPKAFKLEFRNSSSLDVPAHFGRGDGIGAAGGESNRSTVVVLPRTTFENPRLLRLIQRSDRIGVRDGRLTARIGINSKRDYGKNPVDSRGSGGERR